MEANNLNEGLRTMAIHPELRRFRGVRACTTPQRRTYSGFPSNSIDGYHVVIARQQAESLACAGCRHVKKFNFYQSKSTYKVLIG